MRLATPQAGVRIFSAQVEVGEELELIPAYTLALSGCNLRCCFCITGRESWDARAGVPFSAADAARPARRALEAGQARSVLILGGEPTLAPAWLREFATHLPKKAPLVLKTNGICSATTRAALDGVFTHWLVDYKFGNDACALALARVGGYLAALRETLLWAAGRSELIIRHLLLPGHVQCCWEPVAHWLARHLPGVKVSLRPGYWPAWQAARQPGLGRPLGSSEAEAALAIAGSAGLNLIP